MKAVIDALNVTYAEKEKRGFIKLNLISLAMTGGAILALLVALGAIVVLPLVLSYMGLGGWTETLLRLLRWPLLLGLVIFGLAVLYRFGPSREFPAMGVAYSRKCFCCFRVACGFSAAVMVFSEFCELRCHLWLARRGHRHDDLDVDVVHRDFARCRTQLRSRASNCA